MFDIKYFLEEHNVYYRERGSGVKRGNVVIHCPYCGDSDKGQHLGISLSGGAWGCWRNSEHRSGDLAKLVATIGSMPYHQARKLIGGDKRRTVESDAFDEIASTDYFAKPIAKSARVRTLLFPKEFRELEGCAAAPFIGYMESRGFTDIQELVEMYGLMYARTGPYKSRIIIPVYFNGQLVTWTSRAITRNAALRYRSLSEDCSSINIKDTVYNYDRAREGGEVLFIVEGPIDALKVDFYLREYPAHAVGLFNMSISDDQLYWLLKLFDLYSRVVLLLDAGEAEGVARGIVTLSATGTIIDEGALPNGVSDPGELKRYQAVRLYKEWSV